ncbi:hypothetical protein FNF29_01990 [Cafeteria roenbergensis]|uniref:Uncharacterized protein n=3 Tax=Cafeteria roenbergensis TaxID=33653 RepID=A0A5A8CR94_CAFRO|nr:hypothetical protein FNF29_01990 [Cafeteria roenbergensis]|eukprot:KAA0155239.1 hypothetical protein FNF29_01990 [Cafeteria roenbergensis]
MAAEQLHVRRATPLDHEAIRSFLAEDISTHRRRFGDFDVARLLETAALSIVAVAEARAHEQDAPIAGFAAFSTAPTNPDGDEVSDSRFLEWYAGRLGAADESEECKAGSALWAPVIAASDGVAPQRAVVAAMLRAVFATLPFVDRALVILPPGLEPFAPLVPGAFAVTVETTDEVGGAAAAALAEAAAGDLPASAPAPLTASIASVCPTLAGHGVLECHRRRVLPVLAVRHARVEDHDDLAGVFDGRSDVVSDSFGEFFLADVIESAAEARDATGPGGEAEGESPSTVALVGMSPGSGRAVSLLVTTAEPDVDVLAQGYDLAPFGGLRRATAEAEAAAEAATRSSARSRRDWLSCMTAHVGELSQIFAAAATEEAEEEDSGSGSGAAGDGLGAVASGVEAEAQAEAEAAGRPRMVPAAPVAALADALDRAGEGWGFEGAWGLGLGRSMLAALRADAAREDEAERLVELESRGGVAGPRGGPDASAASGAGAGEEADSAAAAAGPAQGPRSRALASDESLVTQSRLNSAVEAFRTTRARQQRRLRLARLWAWAGPDGAPAAGASGAGERPFSGRAGADSARSAGSGSGSGSAAGNGDGSHVAEGEGPHGGDNPAAVSYAGSCVREEAEALLAAVRELLEQRAAQERQAREEAAAKRQAARLAAADSEDEDEEEEEEEFEADEAEEEFEGGAAGDGAADGAGAGGDKPGSGGRAGAGRRGGRRRGGEGSGSDRGNGMGPAEAALLVPLRVPVSEVAAAITERAAEEAWPWAWETGAGGASHGPGQDLVDELEALAIELSAAAGGIGAAAVPGAVGAALGMHGGVGEGQAPLLGDAPGLAAKDSADVTAERFAEALGWWEADRAEAGAARVVVTGEDAAAAEATAEAVAGLLGVALIRAGPASLELARADAEREEALAAARAAELETRQAAAAKAAKKRKAKKDSKKDGKKGSGGGGGKKKEGKKAGGAGGKKSSADKDKGKDDEDEAPPDLTHRLDEDVDPALLPPPNDGLRGPLRWLARRLAQPDCRRGYVLVGWDLDADTLERLDRDARVPPLTAASLAAAASAAPGAGGHAAPSAGAAAAGAATATATAAAAAAAAATAGSGSGASDGGSPRSTAGPAAAAAAAAAGAAAAAAAWTASTGQTSVSPSDLAMALAQTRTEPTLVVVAAASTAEARSAGLASPHAEGKPGWAAVAPVAVASATAGARSLSDWERTGLRAALVASGALGLLQDADAHGEALPDEARQLANDAGPGPINAFAVALLGSSPAWESRCFDLLPAAFAAMPHAEYAILTLPHAAPQPVIAEAFVPAEPLPGCTLHHRLLVLHRAALGAPGALEVRPALPGDRLAVLAMASGTATAVPLLRDLVAATASAEAARLEAESAARPPPPLLPPAPPTSGPGSDRPPSERAFVVLAEGQVVGAVVVSNEGCGEAAVTALRQAYDVDALCNVPAASGSAAGPGDAMACLNHLVINPLFSAPPSVRHVLSQVLLQTRRQALIHRAEDVDAVEAAAGAEDRAAAANGVDVTAPVVAGAAAAGEEQRPFATDDAGEMGVARVERGPASQVEAALAELIRVAPTDPALPLGWAAQGSAEGSAGDGHAGGLPGAPQGASSSGSGEGGRLAAAGPSQWREDPLQLRHPLFLQSRRLLTEPRAAVGARVVLVGASDCGLAALARMRAAPHLRLAPPVVISPGGLRARRLDGIAGLGSAFGADRARADAAAVADGEAAPALGTAPRLCHEDLRRLGLTASSPDVVAIDGRIVSIEREFRTVTLQDGSKVPFDVLVLAPGLCESTGKALGWPSGGRAGVVTVSGAGAGARLVGAVRDLLDAVTNEDAAHAAAQADVGTGPSDLPAVEGATAADTEDLRVGADAGRDVVVWGDGLGAVSALQALVELGVDASRLLLVRRAATTAALGLGTGSDDERLFPAAGGDGAGAHGPSEAAEEASCFQEEQEAWLAASGIESMWGWRLVRVSDGDEDRETGRPRLLLGLQTGAQDDAAGSAAGAAAAGSAGAGAGGFGDGSGALDEEGAWELAMTEEDRAELEEALDEIEDEDERERRRRDAIRAARLTAAGLRDVTLDCRLLVCGDDDDVDPTFFRAVNACGLVYDGRLVVDHRLTTTDDTILAGGRVAKFSRRFRSRRLMQDIDSLEAGRVLGAEVLARIDPVSAAVAAEEEEDRRAFAESVGADSSGTKGSSMLPRLEAPTVTQARLPGGRWFLRVALPRFEVRGGGRVIHTRVRAVDAGVSPADAALAAAPRAGAAAADGDGAGDGAKDSFADRVCRAVVDRHGRLAEVAVLSPRPVAVANVARTVGLPLAWLRDLEADLRSGRSRDLVWHMDQPWAAAVLHPAFRAELDASLAALRGSPLPGDEGMPPDVLDFVQELLDKVREASALEADAAAKAAAGGQEGESKDADDADDVHHERDEEADDDEGGDEEGGPDKGRAGTGPAPKHMEAIRASLLGSGASVPSSVRRAMELRAIRFVKAHSHALPRYFLPGIH